MVSGGVDSAYLLYKLLKDGDKNLHAHHIKFITHNQFYRWDVEEKAYHDIVNYLSKVRNFSHSTSTVDLSTFPYTGWDSDLQLYVGSRVAMNLTADKVSLAIGDNADDYISGDVKDRAERNVSTNLWKALHESMDEIFREKVSEDVDYPLKNMTKQQILDDMPQDLLDLCWSCREPVRKGEKVTACGKCHACKQLQK
jgi:tRNA(Ile)-lysidine synthase TilS/MesJ